MEIPDGCLVFNKPSGITSFQALTPLKRIFGNKLGHSGTLDKFAEGVLVILFGKLTRCVPLVMDLPKQYRAKIKFGETTTTLDPEGSKTIGGSVPSLDQITLAIKNFLGEIEQIPPVFSSIHVGGKRSYQRALGGEEFELKARKISIFRNEIVEYCPPFLTLEIDCSKGTYVRSLARDIAQKLGTLGYLVELKRTKIGKFSLENKNENPSDSPLPIKPLDFFDLLGLPRKFTDFMDKIKNGQPLHQLENLALLEDGLSALFDRAGRWALVKKEGGTLSYFLN